MKLVLSDLRAYNVMTFALSGAGRVKVLTSSLDCADRSTSGGQLVVSLQHTGGHILSMLSQFVVALPTPLSLTTSMHAQLNGSLSLSPWLFLKFPAGI